MTEKWEAQDQKYSPERISKYDTLARGLWDIITKMDWPAHRQEALDLMKQMLAFGLNPGERQVTEFGMEKIIDAMVKYDFELSDLGISYEDFDNLHRLAPKLAIRQLRKDSSKKLPEI